MTDAALLVQNVRRSMAANHDVLGYVGTETSGAHVLLGRDLTTSALVGISVSVAADGETLNAPQIQSTLARTLTVPGSMCPECRTPLVELDAFCFHCGANLSGSTAALGSPESAIVLDALATATAERYEILGRIDRESSTSAAYFARDVLNEQIVALRLKRVDAIEASRPEYVQKLTQIFDTGELQAKAAQRKAEQAEVDRLVAERAATAERAAAAERVAAERIAAERAATERAAAETAKAERVAAERAAAALHLTNTPTPVTDISLDQASFVAPVSPLIATYDTTPTVEASAPLPKKSGAMRTRLFTGGGVVAVLAVLGYFALRGGSDAPNATTATAVTDSINAATAQQPPIDTSSLATPATDAAVTTATTPTTAATTPPATTATDSGTIRITNIPADARVTVDGRTMRGRTLRVTARSHQLTVTANGFEPFTEKLNVASGATVRWSPKLAAIVASNTPATNAPAAVSPSTPNSSGNKKSCRELVRAEDWEAAHDACTTEANSGNGFASVSLGRMYAKGQGVTRDAAASINWYQKGAAAGDHDAQSFMGLALREGKGIKRDEKAATEMFRLAAEGGEKVGQLEYGVALEKGDGVSRNQASAREWYKKSADQGVYMAARRLGRMLEKGDGGPKSETEALAAYEKAATLGDAESAMTAGKWYRDGRGATASPAQALTWFKKALELGNKDAAGEIKKLQK